LSGHADRTANWKSAGARRLCGDAGTADHLCADYRRDSRRRRRTVDGVFDQRERRATFPVPANISADGMQANSKAGRALYSGHARLWQGDSVMEADSIELLREARVMNAIGNVRAVFPQAAGQTSVQTLAVQAGPKKPRLWHVTAGTLTYRDTESRAHLKKMSWHNRRSKRCAPLPWISISRGPRSSIRMGRMVPLRKSSGGRPTDQPAVGTGGVIVEQGTRKATADRGEYSAADGKFVMSGGNPTIFDAAEGTTTAIN